MIETTVDDVDEMNTLRTQEYIMPEDVELIEHAMSGVLSLPMDVITATDMAIAASITHNLES